MVIRIWRPLDGLRRVLLQLFHQPTDGSFELNVAAFAPGFRIEFDLDIRRDATVLDIPLAFRSVEGEVRRSHRAAVNQLRVATDADQSTPGAFADQRADLRAAEHIGQIVAARTGVFVDEHGFRTGHYAEWLAEVFAVAHRPIAVQRFTQVINDVISGVPAA